MTFVLPLGHRWFYASSSEAEDWSGPFAFLEHALEDAEKSGTARPYIAPGRKTTAEERRDWGTTKAWQVDSNKAVRFTYS